MKRHRVSFLKKREHDPVHDPGIPVTISCIVTDPMQLSREPFYEDYITPALHLLDSLLIFE